MRQTINYLTDLLDSHRTLLAMSAPRSKRTRRLACVGLCVLKEVLVVTSG